MLQCAAGTIPWARVVFSAGLVVLLMELVGRWPHSTWALQGAAVGLLAAATAWSLDEPAARVVDTTPRSLAWRTVARLPAVAFLLLTWVAAVARTWESLGDHGTTVLLQGVMAVTVGLGWTTWRRAGGAATPGTVFAVGVVPAALAWGLTRMSEWVPVFPYVAADPQDWVASGRGWVATGMLALVLLAAALTDARWWHLRGDRSAAVPATARPRRSR